MPTQQKKQKIHPSPSRISNTSASQKTSKSATNAANVKTATTKTNQVKKKSAKKSTTVKKVSNKHLPKKNNRTNNTPDLLPLSSGRGEYSTPPDRPRSSQLLAALLTRGFKNKTDPTFFVGWWRRWVEVEVGGCVKTGCT